ncbi:Uu.00g085120.m01.CDS01, partial [Anthostomella pinea]
MTKIGINAGFDMVPRLSQSVEEKALWEKFIHSTQTHFNDDAQVENKPYWIEFKLDDHRKLPFEGHKFLRFSSKIQRANGETTEMDKYVNAVTRIAQGIFGHRAQYWNEGRKEQCSYEKREVKESYKFYETPDEPHGPAMPTPIESTLFEVQPIPAKGSGLVALTDIPLGTRIIGEKPLFALHTMPDALLNALLAAKLKVLPRAYQCQFLSMHNRLPGAHPFAGIAKTKCMPCGPGSTTACFYLRLCQLNHSCAPNAHQNWNGDLGHMTLHAARPIAAGEELAITYPACGPSEQRQAKLRAAFDFDCRCEVCALPPDRLARSDERNRMFQTLLLALNDRERVREDPGACLTDCRSLLEGVVEEQGEYARLGAFAAHVHMMAFQIFAGHGDRARAAVCAERAY